MRSFIRDSEGRLCKVIHKVGGVFHAERVADRAIVDIPFNEAKVVKEASAFPGDWEVKQD